MSESFQLQLPNSMHLQMIKKHPFRDWRKLGDCQKIIRHSPNGSSYYAVAANNSDGLLAVADGENQCVHLLTEEGTLVRSIGKGVLGISLFGLAFDLKGNIWVTDRVVKLSQKGQLLKTIQNTTGEHVHFCNPLGVSVNQEGLIYICDCNNHCVTVHDEEGKFLLAFGREGSGPECFDWPEAIAFDSDGFAYVTDGGNKRVCVWSKEGSFKGNFKTKFTPSYIAATTDNHLVILSRPHNIAMVYTPDGQLIHQFGEKGCHPGKFNNCWGICISNSGLVFIADGFNKRVQVFWTSFELTHI